MPEISTLSSLDLPLPGDTVVIDLWLEHSSTLDRDPIGLKGEPSYRYFWSTWLHYLKTGGNGAQPNPIPWHEVTNVDVVRFLQSGPSARKAGGQVSIITRHRYWRLLERIYAYAQMQGWVAQNPAEMVDEADKPPQEDHQGAIMTPAIWRAFLRMLDKPESDEALHLRNHALLLCLAELAITPMEARKLTVASVLYEGEGVRRWPQALQLDGPGPNQRRRMVLPVNVASALAAWLAVRDQVASAEDVPALFCTSLGAKGGMKGEMTSITLLKVVTDAITKASVLANLPPPVRLGPQIVRNTRLVMWLNECVPSSQVAVWAGLKNIKGLYHLREHLNPEVRLTVKSVRDDEPAPPYAAQIGLI